MTEPPEGARVPVALVGDGVAVPCITGETRPYVNLDAAASTAALPTVAARVNDFLPWYSSVHRGAGYKSRLSTNEYEAARAAALAFAGRATDQRRRGHLLSQHHRGHQPSGLPAPSQP